MIHLDLKPDRKKLRQFGVVGVVGFALLGWLVYHKTGIEAICWVGAGLAVFSALASIIAPVLLFPLYWLLSAIAFPIGFVISNVILFLIFHLMFTPLGLLFRLVGRDGLGRFPDFKSDSFWIKRTEKRSAASYYKQY